MSTKEWDLGPEPADLPWDTEDAESPSGTRVAAKASVWDEWLDEDAGTEESSAALDVEAMADEIRQAIDIDPSVPVDIFDIAERSGGRITVTQGPLPSVPIVIADGYPPWLAQVRGDLPRCEIAFGVAIAVAEAYLAQSSSLYSEEDVEALAAALLLPLAALRGAARSFSTLDIDHVAESFDVPRRVVQARLRAVFCRDDSGTLPM